MGLVEFICLAFTRMPRESYRSWLKCCFTSTETVGLLETGAQDVHLDFHTAPELSELP